MNFILTGIIGIVAAVGSFFAFNQNENLGAVSFPTSIDTFTNPTATDRTNVVPHAQQHADANDALEALEAKVGADGSAVTSSHTYKLSNVTGSDKAASLTGSETLTNKSLTSPNVTGMTATNSTLIGTTLNATTTIASTTITKFVSTSGTSTSLQATTLGVGSDYITDITGTGLSITNGVLNASAGAVQAATGTPTTSITVGSGQKAMVWASGVVDGTDSSPHSLLLKAGALTLHSITYDIGGSDAGQLFPFSLIGLIDFATTTVISVSDDGGGNVNNLNIMYSLF